MKQNVKMEHIRLHPHPCQFIIHNNPNIRSGRFQGDCLAKNVYAFLPSFQHRDSNHSYEFNKDAFRYITLFATLTQILSKSQ